MKSSIRWDDALVSAIHDVTPTVREFTLQPTNGALPHEPGAHLQVQLLIDGRVHTRSYSLIGEGRDGGYRIAVKQLPQGRGGSMAMWRLGVGERLRISEPQNHFPLDAEPGAVLLVAGGIGVTPMVSMAQSLARRGPWLRMVYAARAPSELAYRTELQRALGERLQCVVRSQGESLDLGAEISALPEGGQMFVCGPVTLLDAARRAWRDAGRPIADLRYETFGSSGRFAPQAFRVRVPRHGLDFTVGADTSLLDALEQQGVQAMHDCRRGECGLCAVDVLALNGEIDHRDVFLSDAEKESGRRICVCVSRVVGEITLDSAWRPDR